MRAINVSTPVYSAIWAARKEGEESEDAVLKRLLNVPDEKNPPVLGKTSGVYLNGGGVHIEEFDVHFSEGEEIFRNYKGTDYRARATNGKWLLLNDGKLYPSLHKLSDAVVHGRENSWTNWRCRASSGKEVFIDALRPEEKVRRRLTSTSILTAEELGL